MANQSDSKLVPNYYVAIGASAGGLEALHEFVQELPSDSGAAFIIIQHLSPDFKSVMAELLSRHTSMPIYNAEDGAVVEANTIYLIPARKNMMIAEGKLLLADQMPDTGIHFPIDIFFRSIAEDQHHHSMGVILSGTGSDGSRGLLAIKEVGGLVLVQDPASAKFDGMPFNAVKTGVVDVVASASELPAKIVNYITHPIVSGSEKALASAVKSDTGALKEIYQLLREKSNIDFTQYKPATVERRIERRIGINGLSSLQEYYNFILKHPPEMAILSKDMLIGVTRFFRDDEPFKMLETKIIPSILEDTPVTEPIRVWVAGCSTGEEAYSIAILFDEAMNERAEARSIKIFATDVDPDAIAEASAGEFSTNILTDMSETRFKKYFTHTSSHATIASNIRQMVVFATHNLMKDPPFSNTQLAICRNVLIYFQPPAQRRVLSMLHFSLKKNGYLFLGNSETLGDLASHFETTHERNRFYRKISNVRSVHNTMSNIGLVNAKNPAMPSVEQLYRSYQRNQPASSFPSITESLIQDYAPPAIVLDGDLEILHVYGDVTAYTRKLQPGKFRSSIEDVISPDLEIAVSTALHRARTEEDSVKYDNIQVTTDNGQTENINLRVRCVKQSSAALQLYFIVIFEPSQRVITSTDTSLTFDAKDQVQQRIRDLELQLHQKQEHLQVIIEELETTNEELQSSNEELMAANEELQSTNEELQSVNEELYTVNSEYQEKIEEITRVNTDLDNIIKSTDIGIIFLDNAMLIRNYTPAATQAVNLLPSDIGRPFHHISHKLHYNGLLKDVAKVIEDGLRIEKNIQTVHGNIMSITLTAYIDEFNVNNGCVITLTDNTEKINLKTRLVDSYNELRGTINTSLVSSCTKVQVLILDDDPDDCLLVKHQLNGDAQLSGDFQATAVHTLEEAQDLLQKTHFDVCLVDYYLGNRNGLELIETLAAPKSSTAFIVLSGALQNATREKALELGVYDAIDKAHMTPYLLERSIRYAIRHKKTELFLLAQTLNTPTI